jgi:hypothetical protein
VPSLSGSSLPGSVAPAGAAIAAAEMAQSEEEHRAASAGAPQPPPLGSADGNHAKTLLSGLGPDNRTLTAVTTTSGGVCVVLTGVPVECVPTFQADQEVIAFTSSPSKADTVVWGVARDDVTSIDAIDVDGATHAAEVGSGAFYADLGNASPDRLIVHLADGSSDTVTPAPCPLTNPACTTP